MTEEHESDREQPAFDDPEHAWVRDLLADARVTTPVPAEVAARLDEALAELQAQRAADEGPEGAVAPVVPLRRRLGPRLAAAAAAVVLVAAGGVAVAQLGDGGGPGTSGSAGSAPARSGDTAASPAPGLSSGQAPPAVSDAAALQLTTASFAADAAAVMRRVAATQTQPEGTGGTLGSTTPSTPAPGATPAEGQPGAVAGSAGSTALTAPPVTATPEGVRPDLRSPAAASCTGPTVTGAVTLPATLDGSRVALLFRPPTAAGQRVEAWSCDGSTMLAHATIAP